MITRKGIFYLIWLVGFALIAFKGIPVNYDHSVSHISLFPSGNSSDQLHEFIDYKKLAAYAIAWGLLGFMLYKLANEVRINKKRSN